MPLTYDELIRRIPVWLYAQNRTLVNEMPAIVEEAEDQLMLVLDHDLFRAALTPRTITSANPTVDLTNEDPQVMEVRSMRIRPRGPSGGWVPLMRRDIEAMEMLYSRDRPRVPRYYAEDDGILTYQFFPAPVVDTEVEIMANIHPLRLGPTQQTSVLTEQFPRALEKATLRQGALFMKNQTDADRYEAEMMQSVEEANLQVKRRRRDTSGQRPRETANLTGS